MRRSVLAMLSAFVLTGLAAAPALADSIYGTPRQYYSGYTHVPSHNYGYRTYYFKPTPDYAGYQHHYVIYPQHDPHHAYYYNPETQAYWGRCPSQCHGQPLYSLLRPIHRKSSLAEIPVNRFPKPGPLPVVPGAQDNTVLDLAPDDTPVVAAPAAGALPTAAAPPAGAAPPPGAGAPAGVPVANAPPVGAPPAAAAAPPASP